MIPLPDELAIYRKIYSNTLCLFSIQHDEATDRCHLIANAWFHDGMLAGESLFFTHYGITAFTSFKIRHDFIHEVNSGQTVSKYHCSNNIWKIPKFTNTCKITISTVYNKNRQIRKRDTVLPKEFFICLQTTRMEQIHYADD